MADESPGAARPDRPDERPSEGRWLSGVRTVGISRGPSAPEVLAEQALDPLRDMDDGKVQMATVGAEDVVFSLPPALAEPRGAGRDGERKAPR